MIRFNASSYRVSDSSSQLYERNGYCKPTQGFTLVELMVTIAVLAIIASIAVPSFQNQFVESRMKDTTSVIYNAMKEAKSESFLLKSAVSINYGKAEDEDEEDTIYLKDDNDNVIAKYNINERSSFTSSASTSSDKLTEFNSGKRAEAITLTICDEADNETPRQVSVDVIANISTTQAGSC